MKKLFIPLLAILALSLQIKAQVKTNFNNTERVNERGHFNKSYATFTFEITPPVWSQDWEPTYLASGPFAYFTMPDTPRCYTVRVEKTNACGGTVVTQKKICVVECNGMRLLASPNPATSQLIITLIDEKEGKNKIIKQENIQIEFYNLNVGIKQKEWKYNTTAQRQFTLNIADIAKGMYVVKVTKGKLQATIKIIKD